MYKTSPENPGQKRPQAGLRSKPQSHPGLSQATGVNAMCSEGLRPEPKPGFILKKNHCINQLVVFAEIAWT